MMDILNRRRRFLRAVSAALAVLLLSVFAVPLRAPADSIAALQDQYSQLQQQQRKLQEQVKAQSSAAQAGEQRVQNLSDQISVTKQQLAVLQAQVSAADTAVKNKEQEISDTLAKQNYNMELLEQRLRAMYISGKDTYLVVLLSSSSMSDFLSRMEIVRVVARHDEKVIHDLEQSEARLRQEHAALEKTRQILQKTEDTIAAKQDTLNAQVAVQAQTVAQEKAGAQTAKQQVSAVGTKAAQTYQRITAAFAARAAAARAAASAGGGGSSAASVTIGGGKLDSSVLAYQGLVTQVAGQFGASQYVALILAVMEQESGGSGSDVMQSLAGGGGTPTDSIVSGVQELKQDLDLAGCHGSGDIAGIQLALQGYNFGSGFISWAKSNGGYTVSNALAYSKLQASELGWSGYGDTYYVPHVLRYYTVP